MIVRKVIGVRFAKVSVNIRTRTGRVLQRHLGRRLCDGGDSSTEDVVLVIVLASASPSLLSPSASAA